MQNKKIPPQFIVRIALKNEAGAVVGEREFITFGGLLAVAHEIGLDSIETSIEEMPSDANGQTAVARAVAKGKPGTFTGLGDASPANVGKRVARHLLRVAETRAKARALRDLCNVHMLALEELEGDDADVGAARSARPAANERPEARRRARVRAPALGRGRRLHRRPALRDRAAHVGRARSARHRWLLLPGTKTRRARRRVPIADPLLEALVDSPRRSGAVVLPWQNVRRDLAVACKAVGIKPVTPNDLRRTFASWMKQAGVDSKAVADLLGHTSTRMVDRVYGHLDDDTYRRALKTLPSRPPAGSEWVLDGGVPEGQMGQPGNEKAAPNAASD